MRLSILLIAALVAVLALSLAFGEAALSPAQYAQALSQPGSPPGEIIFLIRAPRAVCADPSPMNTDQSGVDSRL